MSQLVSPDPESAPVVWGTELDVSWLSAMAERLRSAQEQERLQESGYLAIISPTRPDRVYRASLDGSVVQFEGAVALTGLYLPVAERLPVELVPFIHKWLIQTHEQWYLEIAQRIPAKEESPRAFDLPGPGSPS